jgi:hypothetical protein
MVIRFLRSASSHKLQSQRLAESDLWFSHVVTLIVLAYNDPLGPVLPLRLFTRSLTKAIT